MQELFDAGTLVRPGWAAGFDCSPTNFPRAVSGLYSELFSACIAANSSSAFASEWFAAVQRQNTMFIQTPS